MMDFYFVSSLQLDYIFVTCDFTAIQRGVKFLLPVTVYYYRCTDKYLSVNGNGYKDLEVIVGHEHCLVSSFSSYM